LVVAFKAGVACVNGRRKKIRFVFDDEDIKKAA
jgi:hypothetical protein